MFEVESGKHPRDPERWDREDNTYQPAFESLVWRSPIMDKQ